MKFKNVLLILLLIFSFSASVKAQEPNFDWAKKIGGLDADEIKSLAIDNNGNVYITGYFRASSVDFDPGPGTAYMSSSDYTNVFFAKYDADGNYLWAKRIDAISGTVIKVDDTGNVYLFGHGADSNTDFDPGPGYVSLAYSIYGRDFMAKYDTDGNYIWSKVLTVSSINSVTIDAANNLYIVGGFYGTVDFDPGVGIANLTANGDDYKDTFFAKYDTNGNYIWAKVTGGPGLEEAKSIALSGDANYIYITGIFNDTNADFDPGTGTAYLSSNASYDIFFAKYDTNGNYLWAKKVGGSSDDQSNSIAVDLEDNIYIAGYFGGSNIDFDPSAATANLSSAGGDDAFFAKYDANGNYLWAKNIGESYTYSQDRSHSITTDLANNIYVTGAFSGTNVDFDCGAGIANLSGANGDAFFIKYSKEGNYIWAKKIGGIGGDVGNFIATDKNGNLYLAGNFSETNIDFDPSADIANLNSNGAIDIFFAKYNINSPGSLNFVDDYVTANTGASVLQAPFTIEAWLKPNTTNDITFLSSKTPQDYGFNMKLSGGNIISADIGDGSNWITTNATGIYSYTTNEWIHVACVVNQTSYTIYANGNAVGTGSLSGGIPILFDNNHQINIGWNGTAEYFNGNIDELRIWDTERTQAQIQDNMSCLQSTNPNLILAYNFNNGIPNGDNTTVNTLLDASGNNRNGNLNNFALTGTTSNFTSDFSAVQINASANNVCTGTVITFTAISPNTIGTPTYQWKLNGNTVGTNSNIYSSGSLANNDQVICIVTSSICANVPIKSNRITLTLNQPILNITGNTSVCAGIFATLNATGASSYTWDNGISNGVAFTPSITKTYTVTGTDINGCTSTAKRVVTVKPFPVLTITGNSAVCIGNATSLTATGATSYIWNNGISNGISFTPSITKTYTVSGTTNGCTSTAQRIVSVNPLPVLSITGVAAICSGNATTLTATGASSYTWNNGISNGVNFTPSITKTYTVTGTDTNNCVKSMLHILTVNPTPVISITGPNEVCEGNNATLTATGASSYTWSNGITNGVSFTPNITQTYTVSGISTNGCSNSLNQIVTINNSTYNAETASACNNYEWHATTYTASGLYTYSYNNANGCVSIDTLHLTINNSTHNSETTTACNNYTWHATTYTTSGIYTYSYTNANGCSSVDTLHLTIDNGTYNSEIITACDSYIWHNTTYTTSGIYTYSYNNANGCTSLDTLHLTINNSTHNSETITACDNYVWNAITYTTSGVYTYSYNNANGCASVDTLHLAIKNSTASTINAVACSSYTLNAQTYTASNTYTQIIPNAVGCDSTITINLTIDACTPVWPGDANDDFVADNFDVLNIGLAYGATSYTRNAASNTWIAQPSKNWPQSIGGVNYKHADCDGNGIINDDDTLAIYLNYGQTHSKSDFSKSTDSDPVFSVQFDSDTIVNDTYAVAKIYLGDVSIPANNVYGFAFSINYDSQYIEENSCYISFNNTWLGDVNTNLIRFQKDQYLNAVTHVAVTRKNHTNVSGNGEIGEFHFKTKDIISGANDLNINLSNVKLIDNTGFVMNVQNQGDAVVVKDKLLSVESNTINKNSISIYPNPNNGLFTISATNSLIGAVIKITTVTGQIISENHIENASIINVDLSKEANGFYFVEINQDGKSQRFKLIKN